MNPAESKTGFDWPGLLKTTKEKLVKIFWGLSNVAEGERELAVKELLWEMEQIQNKIQENTARFEHAERITREENELLRSLLGTTDHELRARVLAISQEMHGVRRDFLAAQEEIAALRQQSIAVGQENEALRAEAKEASNQLEALKAQEEHDWQSQMAGFADEQAGLQKKFLELTEDMARVQSIMSTQADEMTKEKQSELAALQTKLLKDMETALTEKEDLLWAEEELFARGVAQKLRGELQAATGRLQLTLEKFHLLDMEGGAQPKTWEQWWRLLKVGPEELRKGFNEVEKDLRLAVKTLEEYLNLTRRQEPAKEDIALPDLVRKTLSQLYTERMQAGALEILVPETLPVTRGDPELLRTILQTLLDNAFEALGKNGGKIRVQMEKSPDGKFLWTTVADTGGGLESAQADRLFQPFFTTKPGHRGLGLARAKRYAEWHRGKLELLRSDAKGTAFRLSLPVDAPPAPRNGGAA